MHEMKTKVKDKSQDQAPAQASSAEAVYRELRKGAGRELVNDDNVDALIHMAEQDGHPVLATELREWQAPCAADPKARP